MTAALTTIPFPGVGVDYKMPAHVYHSIDAYSATGLKTAAKSMLHESERRRKKFEATETLILGTAFHTATLEPDKLASTILVADDCEGVYEHGGRCKSAGKYLAGGRWYCGTHIKKYVRDPLPQLLDEDENLIDAPVLKLEKFIVAKKMAAAVRYDRRARELLDSPTAKTEVSFFWIERVQIDIDGVPQNIEVPCKMRTDLYDPSAVISRWDTNKGRFYTDEIGPTIVDLKSCQDSDRPDFEGDIADRRYDIQNGFYEHGATVATGGVEHKNFFYIAVQSQEPIIACVYEVDGALRSHGEISWREVMRDLVYCQQTNCWPGYSDHRIRKASIGGYGFRKLERERKRDDR